MKKILTSAVAMALACSLTLPVMASPFNDVSNQHWAYDALAKTAEAGLLEGYGTGEFKGDEALSRYQVAVLTSRVLDKIETGNSELDKDVRDAISRLATEFDKELVKINEKIGTSGNVKISGETGIDYKNIDVNGNEEKAYIDPFNQDANGDDEVDDKDKVKAANDFKHFTDFDVKIEKDGVVADLDIKAITNNFGDEDDKNIEVESIKGSITTENFTATIDDEQGLEWTDYLYNGEKDIDGVIIKGGNTTVAVGQTVDVKDLAIKQENIMSLPVNLFAGIEDKGAIDGRDVIVGLDTKFNLGGVDITGELATNDTKLDGRLIRVGVSKDLGIVEVEGNYENRKDFTDIKGKDKFEGTKQGYDLKANKAIDKLEVAVAYEDYDNEKETTLTAEVKEENPYTLYDVDVFGKYEYKLNSKDEVRYVQANKEMGDLTIAAIYDFDKSEDLADKVMSVAYNKDLDIAGIKLNPNAKVELVYDKDNKQGLNTEAGVEANYELNDKLSLTAGYEWAKKEDRVKTNGEFATAKAGIVYKVTEDASATLNFEDTNFVGEDATNNFDTRSIKGGFKIKF